MHRLKAAAPTIAIWGPLRELDRGEETGVEDGVEAVTRSERDEDWSVGIGEKDPIAAELGPNERDEDWSVGIGEEDPIAAELGLNERDECSGKSGTVGGCSRQCLEQKSERKTT